MKNWKITKNNGKEIEWWNKSRLIMVRLLQFSTNEWMIDSNIILLPKSEMLLPPLFLKNKKDAMKIIVKHMKEIL